MSKIVNLSLVIFSSLFLASCTLNPAPNQNQSQDGNSSKGTSFSMRELLAQGKNQKCTFFVSETGEDNTKSETSGTLYIAGNKIAEDVEIKSYDEAVGTVNMKIISDGTYMYSWSPDNKASGMKFKITDTTEDATDDTDSQRQNVDMDKKMDLDCLGWTVDSTKFSVPSDIKFTDVNQMLENLKKVTGIPTIPENLPIDGE